MAGEALPETYKAVVYDEPGKLSTKVVEKPIPEPAAGDVLIRLYAPLPALHSLHRDKADPPRAL